MNGRKPKPTHLRIVTGNAGKRALPAAEPRPVRARVSPPVHLSDKARETWGYVAGLLDRMGVLTEVDALALESLCEAYADLLQARADLDAFGSNYYETVNAQGGVMHRPHPAVAVVSDADKRIKAWLAEFGMTPSARTRVKGASEEEADPADAYFG